MHNKEQILDRIEVEYTIGEWRSLLSEIDDEKHTKAQEWLKREIESLKQQIKECQAELKEMKSKLADRQTDLAAYATARQDADDAIAFWEAELPNLVTEHEATECLTKIRKTGRYNPTTKKILTDSKPEYDLIRKSLHTLGAVYDELWEPYGGQYGVEIQSLNEFYMDFLTEGKKDE